MIVNVLMHALISSSIMVQMNVVLVTKIVKLIILDALVQKKQNVVMLVVKLAMDLNTKTA
jgi:hypothetical protein